MNVVNLEIKHKEYRYFSWFCNQSSKLIRKYVTKILSLPIFSVFMDGVFHCEKPYERSISPTRWYILSDERLYVWLVIGKDTIERLSFKCFPCDRSTRCRDDRHISIEWEGLECIAIDVEKYLDDVSTDAIVFSVSHRRILHDIFIRRIFRVFDDEVIRMHWARVGG